MDKVICKRFARQAEPVLGQMQTNLLVEDASILPEEIDLFSELSAELAQQYDLAGEHAPIVFLGLAVIGYGTRWQRAFSRLEEIAQKNAEAEKNGEKNSKKN